jgi:hypothetical protein
MDATEHTVEYLLDMDLGHNGGRLLAREIDEVERWSLKNVISGTG